METRLIKLKTDFNEINNIRNNVKDIFDILQSRINKLKMFYNEFIKNNKKQMFIFGLDSFHFQNKLIDIEYDDMKRIFIAINNRMYCEYFKLYKFITEYILKNINDKKVLEIIRINNFPIYKDLEPFKEYDFQIIIEIHENVINLLSSLISNLTNKENELSVHKSKKDIGLNIDNFITSFNYDITIMREKIIAFITYIEFFHKLHTKYLKRFSNKIQLMYTHINNDIRFDESVEMNNDKKREIIEEYNNSYTSKNNNIDKELLNDLKNSLHAEFSELSDSDNNTPIKNIVINNDPIKNNIDLVVENNIDCNNYPITENRQNLKQIVKNGIHRMNSLVKTYNSASPRDTPENYSNEEIKTIFSNIQLSCDSIIYEEKNSRIGDVGLPLEYIDNNVIINDNATVNSLNSENKTEVSALTIDNCFTTELVDTIIDSNIEAPLNEEPIDISNNSNPDISNNNIDTITTKKRKSRAKKK